LASEYIALRTQSAHIPPELAEGIEIMDMSIVMPYLQAATIPPRRGGNFDVVRSDFGEVITYVLLEQEFGTKIGYKSVRDRELIETPGRGIDAIGVEDAQDGGKLGLLLAETKVSNDGVSPPAVVDSNDDSLRKQHLAHLNTIEKTKKKVWDVARKALDPALRAVYLRAALLLQHEEWDKLRLIVCCGLIRPKNKYNEADFGTFRISPEDYVPGHVRFLVFCVPGSEIDPIVTNFHMMSTGGGV
jgi:hypothetical protein